jgi:hypothetical protein
VPQAPTNQSRAELVDFAINEHRWVEGTGGHFAEVVMAMQPKVKLVAMVGIGVTGYALGDIAVLDMVGLIDPVIARSRKVIPNTLILPGHQRSDADYVLRRRPDVIAAGGSGLVLPATRELLDHPAFRTDYEEIPDMPGVYRLRRALITARTPP